MPLYQFTVIIERQPEGGYLVTVPALPGCYTEGRTLEEARQMAADAIRAYCASLLKHGEPIPVEEATSNSWAASVWLWNRHNAPIACGHPSPDDSGAAARRF